MESDIRRKMKIYDQTIDGIDLRPSFPKSMLLEVSNICNHACIFCANSKSNRKKGFIEKEFAMRVLSDAYRLGTREVGFYATGEPLVDKNLETYISYAKKLGFEYVFITTNGALLDQQRANSIIKAGVDSIKFSINGANRNDYLLIHGKDDFNQVIENLKIVSELRNKEKKFKLYISFIMTRQTYETMGIFEKNYRKLVDDIIFLKCINQSGYMYEINQYLSVDINAGGYNVNGICPMIFNKLYITYEGYLTLCCADFQNYLVVADLNKENIEESWNNKYAQELRRRHLDHDLKGTLCFNCMDNCDANVFPLRSEYAVLYDNETWNKSEEIVDRISRWQADCKTMLK